MTCKYYINNEVDSNSQRLMVTDAKNKTLSTNQIIYHGPLNTNASITSLLTKISGSDTLLVYDYQSLHLSMYEFETLYNQLKEKNISIHFIHESTSFLSILTQVLSHEKNITSKKIKRSAKLAREQKKIWGRPSIDDQVVKEIQTLYYDEKKPMREISEICGVSLGTVAKYVHQ